MLPAWQLLICSTDLKLLKIHRSTVSSLPSRICFTMISWSPTGLSYLINPAKNVKVCSAIRPLLMLTKLTKFDKASINIIPDDCRHEPSNFRSHGNLLHRTYKTTNLAHSPTDLSRLRYVWALLTLAWGQSPCMTLRILLTTWFLICCSAGVGCM